jgi:hypothetical protein
LPLSEKISEFDFGRRSTGGHVGFAQNEDAAIVVTIEKPFVAVLAVDPQKIGYSRRVENATFWP